MPKLNRDPFLIHYEVVPNVLPKDTLFVHGNLGSRRWWYPTIEVLQKEYASQLPESFSGKAVLVDWLGCGESSAPQRREDLNMKNLAADMLAIVEREKMQEPVIVGHSAGGFISLLSLADERSPFSKALLLDPVGMQGLSVNDEVISRLEEMQRDPSFLEEALGGTMHGVDVKSHEFFQSALLPDARRAMKNNRLWPVSVLSNQDISSTVKSIRVPVRVLHGLEDKTLDISRSEALAKNIEQGEFISMENAGHCLNIENPGRFVAYLLGSY